MRNNVFGPVPSRRLGRSLGVDLVPYKTCSYDCVYCQLGRTTLKTTRQHTWFPLEEIIREVRRQLATCPDYITLSGSGEPTLYTPIHDLIDRLKDLTDIPIAVLTNGSLLWLPQVRQHLTHADLVIPSLDAGDPEMFHLINRPIETIPFWRMLDGLRAFRQDYQGKIWLEVMILDHINTTPRALDNLSRYIGIIAPDKLQLNTVVRPPAEKSAKAVSAGRLDEIAAQLYPATEVIADFHGVHHQPDLIAHRDDITELLRRRPCSVADIANGLGLHLNEALKYLEELITSGEVYSETINDKAFYLTYADN